MFEGFTATRKPGRPTWAIWRAASPYPAATIPPNAS